MKVTEIPVVFTCDTEVLIGIVHAPENPKEKGILAFAAGGPQYRAGVSRQLVYSARTFSEMGVPFMRFDYRGMGDSSGAFAGFKHIEKDIEAAIRIFMKSIPELKEVVLWGGCDAASGVMLHASRFPEVHGMVVMNPFITSSKAQKDSLRKYYIERLLDKAFWKKVFSGKFNPVTSFKTSSPHQGKTDKPQQPPDDTFVKDMLSGMDQFRGQVLLIMNKKNFVSRRFDQVIQQNKQWSQIFNRPNIQRVDLSSDGQEFAMNESRKKMLSIVESWISKK